VRRTAIWLAVRFYMTAIGMMTPQQAVLHESASRHASGKRPDGFRFFLRSKSF
jgi:hypothetical protein